MFKFLRILSFLALVSCFTGFTSSSLTFKRKINFIKLSSTDDSGGKGFGKKKDPPPPKIKQETKPITSKLPSAEKELVEPSNNIDPNMSQDDIIKNTKMFKTSKERRIDDLKEKIKLLQEEEDLIATDPTGGAVPEIVADRMIKRIAFFFGIPVFGGLAIFVGAFFVSKKYDIVVPPNLIAYATQLPFVIGLIGITYAIISSSWEMEEEGSALGIKEFKTNFQRIRDGLARSRDTEKLKQEIEDETKTLDRR